jgi:hypothetical protein
MQVTSAPMDRSLNYMISSFLLVAFISTLFLPVVLRADDGYPSFIVTVKVSDEYDGSALEGAKVRISDPRGTCLSDSNWTGGGGLAYLKITMCTSGMKEMTWDAEVSLSGYAMLKEKFMTKRTGWRQMALNYVMKREKRGKNVYLTVKDASNNTDLTDAKVKMDLLGGFAVGGSHSGSTVNGRASFYATREGRYKVSASHSNFKEESTYLDVDFKGGPESYSIEFSLAPTASPDTLQDKRKLRIHIQGKDAGGTKVPVPGASVSLGPATQSTNAHGHTTFEHTSSLGSLVEVFVQAPGYARKTEQFIVHAGKEPRGWIMTAIGDMMQGAVGGGYIGQEETIVLEQAKILYLIVRVLDDQNKAVDNATVALGQKGTVPTNDKGESRFTLDPEKDKGQDLTVDVTKAGYEDKKWITVPGALLVPHPPGLSVAFTVFLKKVDMETFSRELAGKRQALKDACKGLKLQQDAVFETREAYKKIWQNANIVAREINKASGDCAGALKTRERIKTLVDSYKTDKAWLDARNKDAIARAAKCRTKEDADALEALWESMKIVQSRMPVTAAHAEGQNIRLRKIIGAAARARASAASVNALLPQIKGLREKLESHETNYFSPAYDAVWKARRECIEAHDNVIRNLNDSDPRMKALKASIEAQKPRPGEPCDEEAAKNNIYQLEQTLSVAEKESPIMASGIQAKPLCQGITNADDLIAQASVTDASLELGSSLPEKIKACRSGIAQTLQPAVKVSISGRTPVKEGEKVTLTAQPSGASYRYDWLVNSKDTLSATGDNILTTIAKPAGRHVFYLKVTDLKTGQYLGDAGFNLDVRKILTNIPFRILCSKEEVEVKERVACSARIDDPAVLSSLQNIAAGGWGYYWYVNGKAVQSPGYSIQFSAPKQGASIVAILARATASSGYEELGRATKTLKVSSKAQAPAAGMECWKRKPVKIETTYEKVWGGKEKKHSFVYSESSATLTVTTPQNKTSSNTVSWKPPPATICKGKEVPLSIQSSTNEGALITGDFKHNGQGKTPQVSSWGMLPASSQSNVKFTNKPSISVGSGSWVGTGHIHDCGVRVHWEYE